MTGLSEPLYPNQNPVSVVQQAPPPANEPGYVARSEPINVGTVLLADDDPSSRAVLERWLSMSGHHVQSFVSADALMNGLRGLYADAVVVNPVHRHTLGPKPLSAYAAWAVFRYSHT